ncbi:Inner centromere protein [Trichoplax sp. H2]|nr:Inner centromere protein [Trichoplax sp. H2]|eukprot:RDD41178.1 Inner centromere protein [Trichoplax sp. H2]
MNDYFPRQLINLAQRYYSQTTDSIDKFYKEVYQENLTWLEETLLEVAQDKKQNVSGAALLPKTPSMKRKRQEISKKTYFQLDVSEYTISEDKEENETSQESSVKRGRHKVTQNMNTNNIPHQDERKKNKRKNNQKQCPEAKVTQNVRITRRMAAKMKYDDSSCTENICSISSSTPQSANKLKNTSIGSDCKEIVIPLTPTMNNMNLNTETSVSEDITAFDFGKAGLITTIGKQNSNCAENLSTMSAVSPHPIANEIMNSFIKLPVSAESVSGEKNTMNLLSSRTISTPSRTTIVDSSLNRFLDAASRDTNINNDNDLILGMNEDVHVSLQETLTVIEGITAEADERDVNLTTDTVTFNTYEPMVNTEPLSKNEKVSNCGSESINDEESQEEGNEIIVENEHSSILETDTNILEESPKDTNASFSSASSLKINETPSVMKDQDPCNSRNNCNINGTSGDLRISTDVVKDRNISYNGDTQDCITETRTPMSIAGEQSANLSKSSSNNDVVISLTNERSGIDDGDLYDTPKGRLTSSNVRRKISEETSVEFVNTPVNITQTEQIESPINADINKDPECDNICSNISGTRALLDTKTGRKGNASDPCDIAPIDMNELNSDDKKRKHNGKIWKDEDDVVKAKRPKAEKDSDLEDVKETKDCYVTPPNRFSVAFEDAIDNEIELSTPKFVKTKNITPTTFKVQKGTVSAVVNTSSIASPISQLASLCKTPNNIASGVTSFLKKKTVVMHQREEKKKELETAIKAKAALSQERKQRIEEQRRIKMEDMKRKREEKERRVAEHRAAKAKAEKERNRQLMQKLTQKTQSDKIKIERKTSKVAKTRGVNEIKTKQTSKDLPKKPTEVPMKQSTRGAVKTTLKKSNQLDKNKNAGCLTPMEQVKVDATSVRTEDKESDLAHGIEALSAAKEINVNHFKAAPAQPMSEITDNYQQLRETTSLQRSLFQEKQRHMQQQQQKMIMKLKQEKAELEKILKAKDSGNACHRGNTEPVIYSESSSDKNNSIKGTLSEKKEILNAFFNDENVSTFKTPPSKTKLNNTETEKVKTVISPAIMGVLKESNRTQDSVGNSIYDNKEFKNILKKKVLSTYDISNLNSDDSTDDEDSPRKPIPLWAKTPNLKIALKKQCLSNVSNPDEIFPNVVSPPDLGKIFNRKRSRYNKRTSSAYWDSPIISKT